MARDTKIDSAMEAQRFSRCTADPAVLVHEITQRLQRSAHRAADLGAALEARLRPIASRSASISHSALSAAGSCA